MIKLICLGSLFFAANVATANTKLTTLIKNRDVVRIKYVLANDTTVILNGNTGITESTSPLIEAVKVNSAEITQLLIDAGADVNYQLRYSFYSGDGYSQPERYVNVSTNALAEALTAHSNFDILKILLQNKANVNTPQQTNSKSKYQGYTFNKAKFPIYFAISSYPEAIELLLANGANIQKCTDDSSCLNLDLNGVASSLNLLLQFSNLSDKNLADSARLFHDFLTRYDISNFNQIFIDSYNIFLQRRISLDCNDHINLAAVNNNSALIDFLSNHCSANAFDRNGNTPLVSIIKGYLQKKGTLTEAQDSIKLLLKLGADTELLTNEGWTALTYINDTISKHDTSIPKANLKQLAQTLIDAGAKP